MYHMENYSEQHWPFKCEAEPSAVKLCSCSGSRERENQEKDGCIGVGTGADGKWKLMVM